MFAYLGLLVGVMITIVYNADVISLSFAIAACIFIIGYALYRFGMLGAGDYFELATISLIFPIQPTPILTNALQSSFPIASPFVLSVFIATGFAAIWIVPIYYLFMKPGSKLTINVDSLHIIYGIMLFCIYIILFTIIYFIFGFDIRRFAFLLLIALPSSITLMFEEEITSRMVEKISPRELEDGDIIALNLMDRKEIDYFFKYKGFGRLATNKLIDRLKNEKRKLPVYKAAAPLAFFILIGVVITLVFGNIIFYVL